MASAESTRALAKTERNRRRERPDAPMSTNAALIDAVTIWASHRPVKPRPSAQAAHTIGGASVAASKHEVEAQAAQAVMNAVRMHREQRPNLCVIENGICGSPSLRHLNFSWRRRTSQHGPRSGFQGSDHHLDRSGPVLQQAGARSPQTSAAPLAVAVQRRCELRTWIADHDRGVKNAQIIVTFCLSIRVPFVFDIFLFAERAELIDRSTSTSVFFS